MPLIICRVVVARSTTPNAVTYMNTPVSGGRPTNGGGIVQCSFSSTSGRSSIGLANGKCWMRPGYCDSSTKRKR